MIDILWFSVHARDQFSLSHRTKDNLMCLRKQENSRSLCSQSRHCPLCQRRQKGEDSPMIIETVDKVTLVIHPATADRTLVQVTFAASGHQCHFVALKYTAEWQVQGVNKSWACCAAVPDHDLWVTSNGDVSFMAKICISHKCAVTCQCEAEMFVKVVGDLCLLTVGRMSSCSRQWDYEQLNIQYTRTL